MVLTFSLKRARQLVKKWNSKADVIKHYGYYHVAILAYDKDAMCDRWKLLSDGFRTGREVDIYLEGVCDHDVIHRELKIES